MAVRCGSLSAIVEGVADVEVASWPGYSVEAKHIGLVPSVKTESLGEVSKTTDRATAERRFRDWLDELDATAWGEKPKRTYSEAEDRIHSRAPDSYQTAVRHPLRR